MFFKLSLKLTYQKQPNHVSNMSLKLANYKLTAKQPLPNILRETTKNPKSIGYFAINGNLPSEAIPTIHS